MLFLTSLVSHLFVGIPTQISATVGVKSVLAKAHTGVIDYGSLIINSTSLLLHHYPSLEMI